MKLYINKLTFILLLLFIGGGCSQSTDEKVAEAILSANIHLSSSNCSSAISILEDVGRQNSNASYLKTLASAYACAAGFNELTFFGKDLGDFTGLTGASTLSTSAMSAADDTQYESLQTAIDILLYAGGIASTKNPPAALRQTHFNSNDAGDINAQLMYMLMAQLGKFSYYYGNTNSLGAKGEGAQGSNTCFFDYDNAITFNPAATTMAAYLDGLAAGNNCGSAGTGHNDFNPAATKVARLCQGVVLLNNFTDIFPDVISSFAGDNFNVMAGLEVLIDGYKADVINADPDIATILAVQSQARCESENSGTDRYLQLYYAFMYEVMLP